MKDCQQYQDELISLLYEDEEGSSVLKQHVDSCSSCSHELLQFKQTQNLFSQTQDAFPSARIEQKIFEAVQPKGFFEAFDFKRFFLHPATVGISVFALTLIGTLSFKDSFFQSSSLQFAQKQEENSFSSEAAQAAAAPSILNSEEVHERDLESNYKQVAYRMLDWNPNPRFVPDLDKPVLRTTALPNLEQAAVESVSSFQHEIAYRHIMDGDFQQASQILNRLIERDQRYSQWEQAVIQHLQLMKQIGDEDAVQKDMVRIRALAQNNPVLLERAQQIVQ